MSPSRSRIHSLRTALSVVAVVLMLVGCGGEDPTDPDPTPDGSLSATVDGVAFTAETSTVSAEATPNIAGGYTISGTFQPGVGGHLLTLNLYNIDAPGTYPLGVNPTIFGGYATYTRSSGETWQSPLSGAAGEVVITTLSASRIVGTFHFFATPFPFTQATGTRNLTQGQFDLPIEGTVTPVPDDTGSRFSASLDGSFYSAAYAALVHSGNIHAITTFTNSYTLDFILNDIAGPGVYAISFLPPSRDAVVGAGSDAPAGSNCCWGPGTGDTGTLTITSLTADRMVGTFSMTLAPRAGTQASAPLVITNGSFDLGFVGSP